MSAKSKLTMLVELSDKLFNNKLNKLQSKFNKGIDKMRIKWKGLVDEVPGLGRAFDLIGNPLIAITAGVLALTAITSKSVQAAEKFDTAFLPIRQLNLDKSKVEMDAYRNQIKDAAFEVGSNLEKSTNAMYDLQSATGLYGKDAVEVFKKVGRYSFATGADINDAMNSTTKSMKAFGIGVDKIDQLLESNAKTVQVGITTFNELARVQTEYAGDTSAAGQTIDTGNKIFAMFTSIAKNSDIAANQTKTFFQGLGQQAEKIKKHLDIDVFDVSGNMKAADKLLVEISQKFKGLKDNQITEIINQIGGPEGLRAALAKAKTGAEDMISTFDAFDSSKFSLKDAIKNAEGDFKKMKEIFYNRIEILLTKFGEKLIPMLANIFDKLTPVLEWLYRNFDTVITFVGTFISVLGGLTTAVWLVNTAMYANPIGLIILAIAALIALIVLAIAKWHEWGAVLTILMGPLGMLINLIMTLKTHWDSIAKAFKNGGIIAGLKRIGIVLMDAILKPMQQFLELIAQIPGLEKLGGKGAENVQKLRSKLDLITPEEIATKSKEEPEGNKSLYDVKGLLDGANKGGGAKPTTGSGRLSKALNKVTGDAKQVRNVTVTIGSLNSGGINLKEGSTKGLTLQDVENWFNEAMMRVIRNVETS